MLTQCKWSGVCVSCNNRTMNHIVAPDGKCSGLHLCDEKCLEDAKEVVDGWMKILGEHHPVS